MIADLWRLDVADLARLIPIGRASARESTEFCLFRPRAIDPAVNAVGRVLEEGALGAAYTADGRPARGALDPLYGVPVTTNHG
jgi:Asp-tRNA(Asn)/Glu-tRNA(Gln) amidotransferase A subunit family amidase